MGSRMWPVGSGTHKNNLVQLSSREIASRDPDCSMSPSHNEEVCELFYTQWALLPPFSSSQPLY